MKILLISIIIIELIITTAIYGKSKKDLLNMQNTISPIIRQISERLGEYENIQTSTPAKGGQLIYKREPCQDCISGIGNVYYIRVYEWEWENDKLWHRPIHDVPLGCHSCIAENEVMIPYADKKLQNAKLGIKFYR